MEKTNTQDLSSRRPLATRNKAWAHILAAKLSLWNISPNQISILSIVGAAVALLGFSISQPSAQDSLLIIAIVGIQFRLLCNMMDGMVAIEYKKKSAVGDLYNEVPDRIADAMIILGAGLYCRNYDVAMTLTGINIFLAVLTAYIRTLGASLGQGHQYLGPMAKQHRMALLTAGAALELVFHVHAVYGTLWIMFTGLLVTNYRRVHHLASTLKAKG